MASLNQRSRPSESDEWSSAILRAVPDLMFLQTMDGVYLDYHAPDPSQLLVPGEQFLGRNMRDVLPPALLRAIEPAFVHAAGAVGPVVVEYDLDMHDGKRHYEARLVRSGRDKMLTLVRDITDRKRAEAALRESAQRYALASAAGGVGVWDWNLETNELYVDPGLKSLLGFDDDEITRRPEDWGSRVHPADVPVTTALVQACIDGDTDVYEVEHRMVHKDGSVRWFLSRGSAMRAEDGSLRRFVGTKVDITERKRAAEQFHRALEATTTGMLMVSQTGRIVLVNAHVERLFGHSREGLINAPVEMLLPLGSLRTQFDEPCAFPWEDGAFALGGSHALETRRKDGSEIPLEIEFSPIRTSEGEFVLCSITDVTERRGVERERDDLLRHLRDMAGRLIAAQEMERARLARDLHDDVSQQIAALSITLSGLKRHVKAPRGTELEAEVAMLQERTDALAESVRRLSHDLHPDVLRHAGLAASLAAYCNGLVSPSHGLTVTCRAQGDFDAIGHDAALCFYRIAQEALHNVVKHAEARHAEVALIRTPDGAELTVSDDGKGFDIQVRTAGTGLGLVSITERARLAGGTVSIVTALKKGTQVRVHVPLALPSAADATALSGRFAGSA
jgi:PAS domain S-box-containing protein